MSLYTFNPCFLLSHSLISKDPLHATKIIIEASHLMVQLTLLHCQQILIINSNLPLYYLHTILWRPPVQKKDQSHIHQTFQHWLVFCFSVSLFSVFLQRCTELFTIFRKHLSLSWFCVFVHIAVWKIIENESKKQW